MRLAVESRIGFGEIAPVPWFGTETLAEAQAFCASWPEQIEASRLAQVPAALPACQFAIATALQDLNQPSSVFQLPPERICALLPAGREALTVWPALWQTGHRTFKWKIGVHPLPQELKWFDALRSGLPPAARLRLDANGGLTLSAAEQWLTVCDSSAGIEFLEQPLPPEQFDHLMALGDRYATPLALDESVATCDQLAACLQQGWRGSVVIKPAIAGAPGRLKSLCQRYGVDVVVSSVFETGVGRRAVLALAEQISPARALGFGTGDRCCDDWDHLSGEALWQRLQP